MNFAIAYAGQSVVMWVPFQGFYSSRMHQDNRQKTENRMLIRALVKVNVAIRCAEHKGILIPIGKLDPRKATDEARGWGTYFLQHFSWGEVPNDYVTVVACDKYKIRIHECQEDIYHC